jgi:hypothetical protein
MRVENAVQGWYQYIAPLRDQGYTIRGSPAPTTTVAGLGFLKQFLDQTNNEHSPTHVCFHWYGTKFEQLQEWVNNFRGISRGLPLMITEFACHDFGANQVCDEGQVWALAKQAVPWMDQQGDIVAYAPFGASYLSLVSFYLSL